MARARADVLEVVVLARDAQALLHRDRAPRLRLAGAQEVVLELHHAGVGEEQRRVAVRHQRRRRPHAVAAGGEEVEEALADLAAAHRGAATPRCPGFGPGRPNSRRAIEDSTPREALAVEMPGQRRRLQAVRAQPLRGRRARRPARRRRAGRRPAPRPPSPPSTPRRSSSARTRRAPSPARPARAAAKSRASRSSSTWPSRARRSRAASTSPSSKPRSRSLRSSWRRKCGRRASSRSAWS